MIWAETSFRALTILVVSGFLAYYAISIGNDVFAFVKDTEEVQLSITEDTDLETLGTLLTESGIIRYPKIFNFYVGFRYDKLHPALVKRRSISACEHLYFGGRESIAGRGYSP